MNLLGAFIEAKSISSNRLAHEAAEQMALESVPHYAWLALMFREPTPAQAALALHRKISRP